MKRPLPICLLWCVLAFSCSISFPLVADDLQPLKYNHPGLVVDLGVGLWAWPLPMDYDHDGDLDLVVACPDKPSNGIWFFENPSDDPQVSMPVFKPGVRVGPCSHNMQVSYVHGKAIVLREGAKYIDFRNNKFSKTERVYPQSRIHPGRTRANMWRYVDWEGDGDLDFLVGVGDWSDYGWDNAYDAQGVWQNGPLHGYVYLIENRGENYASPRRVQAGGADIDVYGWPSPNLADFDGDGDLDLLCGEFLDGFTLFENVGTRSKPTYQRGRRVLDKRGDEVKMDLQMITPTAIDWDRDGDPDLIVGDEDGRVAFVENLGASRFAQPKYFQQQADTLKFGALATPYAVDWDGDGDEDLLCGNTAGHIGLFNNLGGQPIRWSAPELLKLDGKPLRIQAGTSGSIQGPCEAKWGYTTLSAKRDGDSVRLLVNSIWGRLRQFVKTSAGEIQEVPLVTNQAVAKPDWFWWDAGGHELVTQWRTTPLLVDWLGNGTRQIICLDHHGFLAHSHALKTGEYQPLRRIFRDEDGFLIRLNKKSAGGSGRYKLAICDWDSDGKQDLLVNSENAVWFRNCGKDGSHTVLKRVGNLAHRKVSGHTSSPAVCDFDSDGRPDLLVGAEDGKIYFARHDDCVQFTQQQTQRRAPKKIPPPRFPGLLQEDFVFTKAKFPQCHASTICQTTRGLVVAWFGGTREKAKDVGIWVSYHDGNSWTAPREWANGVQHQTLRHPCWNPVLYQPPGDAPTLLFFKVGPNPREWWGEVMVSYDRGRSFRDRRRLPETIDGPVRCKPILLPDGQTLLCGSSTEYDGWRVHFERNQLQDGQLTDAWSRIGPINDGKQFNAIQPTFLQRADGTLQVLCRTKEGVIATSTSDDGGMTWAELTATNLPNPNSGIEAVTLQDGYHLLVYNHLSTGQSGWGRRGMLNLAMSKDGVEWRRVAVLEQEEKSEFSYPAIIQADDGTVHITYTWKRQRIKHLAIDPSKLVIGDVLTKERF